MRCPRVQKDLEAYAAAELTPRVRERIEAHLQSCPACREALARQKQLQALVRSVPAAPVPEGFASRVVARASQRVDQPLAVSPWLWNPVRWLEWQRIRMGIGTAAALAAGLLLGVHMGHHTWQGSGQQSRARSQMMQADPVAASGLGYLTDFGDSSLAEAYLSLASAPDDQET